jgi:glutamate N-acetyltransferase/amino-acid N-acetyltransferase
MAVGLMSLPVMQPVSGVRLGTAKAGIGQPNRRDLLVMELCEDARVAAVFTRNAFAAAPVVVARHHLRHTSPRLLVANSGNANAGMGLRGLEDARASCRLAADLTGFEAEQVLPFSTGVIGEPLPMDRIRRGLPEAVQELASAGWEEAARAIMTTDTEPKGTSRVVSVDGETLVVTGIAKGSGMIRPNMATMLAFVAIDAALPRELLQAGLERAVAGSFNRITVDGDTSTNDACVLVATGQGAVRVEGADDPRLEAVMQAVEEVFVALAQTIVRDGEGATKLITVQVEGGANPEECDAVAFSVAESPLVKTAFFGKDPNWGRILSAVGRAGLPNLDIARVDIYLDDVCIVRGGARDAEYQEAKGWEVMGRDEITILVQLNRGSVGTRVWTCDLSYDYVRINAAYRT